MICAQAAGLTQKLHQFSHQAWQVTGELFLAQWDPSQLIFAEYAGQPLANVFGSFEAALSQRGVDWDMNLTFRCVKCKYPHHFESEDLMERASVSFSCTGCGTPQEVELPFKKESSVRKLSGQLPVLKPKK